MLLAGKPSDLTTSAEHFVALTRSHQRLVCMFFTAESCALCKRFAAMMNRPGVLFYRVDADRMQGLCNLYNVKQLPTFALIRYGNHVASVTEADDLLVKLPQYA